MKRRCAILDDYQNIALSLADWPSIADQVEVKSFQQHIEEEDELVRALADFEIIVIMRERTPFGAGVLARLPNLKLLITSGMRNAAIDMKAAAAHGVVVCGTASGSEPPTELTWALILGLARNIAPEYQAFRTGGPWQTTIGADLNGRQLGLLGLGKIGTKMAKIAQAFGMRVMAWSPNLTKDKTEPLDVQLASSKDELLETSDFVSIHLVLGERSRNLIGAAEFARMRKTAYLINTSRAGIVDQTAMVEALKNGRIAGAGVDVFEVEPLPADHVLRTLPNLLATPHLGYVAQSNYSKYFKEAVDDIRGYLAGQPVRVIS